MFVGVPDHRVFSNGSRAQFAVSNHGAALQNAEFCCCLKPFWPKVYQLTVHINFVKYKNAINSTNYTCRLVLYLPKFTAVLKVHKCLHRLVN